MAISKEIPETTINSKTAEKISPTFTPTTEIPELKATYTEQAKPRIVVSQKPAIEDVNKIKGEVDEISAGMEEQKAKLEEAKAQPEISVVDYLASQGRQTSFSEREKLAKQYGIENYTGTAAQNTQLLNILKATPPPTEPTPEEKKDEETRKALLGGITPEQYEEQPYYKRPEETEEEYNKRIEGLRQAGVPEPPTRQDSIAEQIESGIYNPEDILKALNYDITGKKIGDYTITEIDEYLRENPLTPAQRFSSQLQNERETIDSAYRDYQSNINKLMAGEIPLTPEEQGQIDTINRTFDRLREKQLLANQNYERGITIAGISEGRQRYAPETHLGNIKQAVNEGIDEIAELDAKRLSMVNELKMAIKDKNYKMISESYDRFREYSSDKMKVLEGIYNVEQTELDKIEKALAEQEKLMREEKQRIQERKEDIVEEATKNFAPQDIIANISAAQDIESAIEAAGEYLQAGKGDIGEYLFYKRQREQQGLPFVDYITFKQTFDKGGTQTERDREMRRAAFEEMSKEFDRILGMTEMPATFAVGFEPEKRKYVPVETYLDYRRQYATNIGDPDDFDDAFSYLLSSADRKKYGIGYLKAEEYLSFGERYEKNKELFTDLKNRGYTRKEAEEDYMIDEGINIIPPTIEKILDEIYG